MYKLFLLSLVMLVIRALAKEDRCLQPATRGPCYAYFEKFAYNQDTDACEVFVYGGCIGNSNNFETKEECEEICLT